MRAVSSAQLQMEAKETWAPDMPESSSRLKTSWFENRLKWLTPSRIPVQPQWSLCETAKDLSDLIEWDYQHPEEAEAEAQGESEGRSHR